MRIVMRIRQLSPSNNFTNCGLSSNSNGHYHIFSINADDFVKYVFWKSGRVFFDFGIGDYTLMT